MSVTNDRHRIANLKGCSTTVRIIRKARSNSRVVPFNTETGEDAGESLLIASDQLTNIRPLAGQGAEVSRTIRIPDRLYKRLERLSRPFETPAEVIERLLIHEE